MAVQEKCANCSEWECSPCGLPRVMQWHCRWGFRPVKGCRERAAANREGIAKLYGVQREGEMPSLFD